jgi:hypothetical protein
MRDVLARSRRAGVFWDGGSGGDGRRDMQGGDGAADLAGDVPLDRGPGAPDLGDDLSGDPRSDTTPTDALPDVPPDMPADPTVRGRGSIRLFAGM